MVHKFVTFFSLLFGRQSVRSADLVHFFFFLMFNTFCFTYCITLEFCFISQFYWLILKLYTYSNMICFVKYFLWIFFFVITHTITYIITFYGKLSFILTPKKMMNFIASLCAISYCIPFRYSNPNEFFTWSLKFCCVHMHLIWLIFHLYLHILSET